MLFGLDGRDRVQKLGNFTIHVNWHPRRRRDRFPSIEERVKLYMSNWYLPPCKDATIGRFYGNYETYLVPADEIDNETWPLLKIRDPWSPVSTKSMTIDSLIAPDRAMILDRRITEDCARNITMYNSGGKLVSDKRIRSRWGMQSYCTEMVKFMNLTDQMDSGQFVSGQTEFTIPSRTNLSTPVLANFGDTRSLREGDSFEIPLISKHRAASTKKFIEEVAGGVVGGVRAPCLRTARVPLKTVYHQEHYENNLSPILWKLETVRHWNTLPGALRKDTPWEQKNNTAFFGGDMTGQVDQSLTSDYERCRSNQRCQFVLDHAGSELIDARLTDHLKYLSNNSINGIEVVRKKVGVEIVQQHKVIISLQGNDVASGLKWSLQSASVVLMPPPTKTSWAMEELLEPWVHYIPMLPDGSNAEEMVRWALNNEKEARRIAERATLFMYDLVYHPDAAVDNRLVKDEIVRRYRDLWH